MSTLVALLGWKISGLVNDISLIKQKAIDTFTSTQAYILKNLGISVKDQTQIMKDEQPSLSGIVQMMLGSFAVLFTNLVLVLVYVFSLLYYREHIKAFLLKF